MNKRKKLPFTVTKFLEYASQLNLLLQKLQWSILAYQRFESKKMILTCVLTYIKVCHLAMVLVSLKNAIVKPETFIYFIEHMTFLSYSFGTLKLQRLRNNSRWIRNLRDWEWKWDSYIEWFTYQRRKDFSHKKLLITISWKLSFLHQFYHPF